MCPITWEMFQDPVIASDGNTYERHAIQQWFQENNNSPLTFIPLEDKTLIPNLLVKRIVDEFHIREEKANIILTQVEGQVIKCSIDLQSTTNLALLYYLALRLKKKVTEVTIYINYKPFTYRSSPQVLHELLPKECAVHTLTFETE